MSHAQVQRVQKAIGDIQAKGPTIPLLRTFLSACGFRQKPDPPPSQRVGSDGTGILAFPEREKPIAFFPFIGTSPDWQRDVYPQLAKCWDTDWTGTQAPTGRAFFVTRAGLLPYVLPIRPSRELPVEPSEELPFAEAHRWSRELLLLTSDTMHAASYWDFLSTPTAKLRQVADKALVGRFDEWSTDIARELAKSSPRLSADSADHIVRSILDQLLFVRFCEDRRVTDLDTTLFDFRTGFRWSSLRALIREYRRILNGDIFDPAVFTDDIVPDSLVQNLLFHLYQDFTFETIPSDMLGRTYERRLARVLQWDPPEARYVEDEDLRKEYGVYYTPEPVARYLATRALDIWRVRATKPLDEVRFFDPCSGSGTFLVQALRALITSVQEDEPEGEGGIDVDERARLLGQAVFGMDMHRAPRERSALACYFEALSGRGVARGERLLPRLLGSNLWQGDACSLDRAVPQGFQADIILLNPPYTGHRSKTAPCWTILQQCIDHLPENGVLGTIVPDGILRNEWLRDIRKHILTSTAIEEFGLVRTRVFEDPNIRPILLLLRKVTPAHIRMAHIPRSVLIPDVTTEVTAVPVNRSAQQASLLQPPLYQFNVHVPDALERLRTRLVDSGRFSRLSDFLLDCSHGVVNPPSGSVCRASDASKSMQKVGKVYLRGKDIKLFRAEWGGDLIDYGAATEATKGTKDSTRSPELFEAPCKLLIRETGSIVRACLDFERRYADNKVILCVPSPTTCSREFLHFLLGYLNSEIGWFWFRLTNPQDPAYMPSLRQSEVEALWVPAIADESELTRIAVLSHRIAQSLASGYLAIDDAPVVDMRRQLLVRLAALLELSEREVNLILDFLSEPASAWKPPFRYPRRFPRVPVVELPPRPCPHADEQDLLSQLPLTVEEQRQKSDWEDIINGPLPDIHEHEPDEEALELGRELDALSGRLDRIERLLKGKGEA